MTLVQNISQAEMKARMEEEFQALQNTFTEHNLTLNSETWQPLVITKNHLDRHRVFQFVNACKDFPELKINAAVEYFTYARYIGDTRTEMGLFAEIPPMDDEIEFYVYFPASYTESSLTLEFMSIRPPTQPSHSVRESVIEDLRMFFTKYWPTYYMKFTPYGSLISGLGFGNTYLNVNIQLDDPDLQRLVKVKNPFEEDKTEPFCKETSIPLLVESGADKISFDSYTQSLRFKWNNRAVEFNFNKEIFTYSTNLINQYLNMDHRVQKFLHMLKLFCRGRSLLALNIKNGVRFYGYTILALAYLSQLNPPVIPNLQHINPSSIDDDCFSETCTSKRKYWDKIIFANRNVGIAARYHDCVENDSTLLKTEYYVRQDPFYGKSYWNSKNKSTVGELFLDFLYYYGYIFDFNNFAVSLKFNGKTPKSSNWNGHSIVIEDPFMATTNLASVVTESKKFIDVFKGAFSVLRGGTCFEELCKGQDVSRYDAPKGIYADRPEYVPLPSWTPSGTSKAFLLIGLPKLVANECYCDRINKLFSTHGKIDRMLDLDSETKLAYFTPDTGDATTVMLPSTFMLSGSLVHLVELYTFTISSITA